MDQAALRAEILALGERFYNAANTAPFVAGKTYIPCTGKTLSAGDLTHLLDASLDMWLTTGRYAEQFEIDLAQRCGVKFARLLNSGSSANLVAFSALTSPKLGDKRITPGSEVITVATGFPTTVTPIIQHGCVPVFIDIELDTANANMTALEAAITPRTRAIMLAHTLGNPFNLSIVTALAKKHDLYVIEDCCDALGATYNDMPVGTFGDMASLSFYPAHQITTGEGGAIFSNSKSLIKLAESFRDWGRDCWCAPGAANTCGTRFECTYGDLPKGYDHKYVYTHLGYNLKATDMQAAIGVSQLKCLDEFVAKRRENFSALHVAFSDAGLAEHFILPTAMPGSNPSWFGFLFILRETSSIKRDAAVRYLENRGIGTRPLFGGNLTRQPAFTQVNHRVCGTLENSDMVMNNGFWVGVWPGIDRQRRDYMAETITAMVKALS